jgi:hypothetical protein
MIQKNKLLLLSIPVALVLLGGVIYKYGILRAEAEMQSINEVESMKSAKLEKYVRLIAEKPALERRIAALEEGRKAEETKLIEGQTPALAAAALQNIVKGLIIGAGGTVTSERIDKPEELGVTHLKVIGVIFHATLPDTGALTNMLYSLETGTPCLSVRDFECRIMNSREPKQLSIQMKVSALMAGR